jgi:hypothetical protein
MLAPPLPSVMFEAVSVRLLPAVAVEALAVNEPISGQRLTGNH